MDREPAENAPSPADRAPPDRTAAAEPHASRTSRLLAAVAAEFAGNVPNIYRMLGENPAVLESFMTRERLLEDGGVSSHGEQAVVALVVAGPAGDRG